MKKVLIDDHVYTVTDQLYADLEDALKKFWGAGFFQIDEYRKRYNDLVDKAKQRVPIMQIHGKFSKHEHKRKINLYEKD